MASYDLRPINYIMSTVAQNVLKYGLNSSAPAMRETSGSVVSIKFGLRSIDTNMSNPTTPKRARSTLHSWGTELTSPM